MKMIKIGIIGCGAVTLKAHIPALMNDPRAMISTYSFQITAVCDMNEANLAYVQCILPHVKLFKDYHVLLSEADCDAVLIATGEYLHPTITKEALARGKFVLCEKPFAASQTELIDFISNIKPEMVNRLQIAFNKRFYPNYLKYQDLKSDDKIKDAIFGSFVFYTQQGKKPGWDGILSNLIHYCDLICSIFWEIGDIQTMCSDLHPITSNGMSLMVVMKSVAGAVINLSFSSDGSWSYPWHEEWQILDMDRNRLVCKNATSLVLNYAGGEQVASEASNSIFWLPDAHGYKSQLKAFYDLVIGELCKPIVSIDDANRAHALFERIKGLSNKGNRINE